jgi:hypothetical protein
VAFGEAIVWALVVGAVVHTARVLAARATTRPEPSELDLSAK